MMIQGKQKTSVSTTGTLTISDHGDIHMKLCWKSAGSLEDLAHSLRDGFIVDPQAVYQKAIEHGFTDIIMLTKTGRITPDGSNQEPEQKDVLREKFSDTDYNPYGKGTSLFMDMGGEFSVARNAELRKAKKK